MDGGKPKRKKAHNGAGSYRQRPDGLWEHRFTLPDGKRKSVYGPTLTECKAKVKILLQQLDQGRDITQRDPTVAEYLNEWIAFIDDGRRAASTMRSYKQHIEHHINPVIGRERLSALSAKRVDQLLKAMQDAGKSPRTAQITRTVLHQAFKQALNWDMVTRNVIARTKNPTVTATARHPLTPDQLRIFFAHCKASGHRLGPIFKVAAVTGMRQGELLGLRWTDVDLSERTIAIRQTLKRDAAGKLTFGTPKTAKSKRVIALSAFAVDALHAQQAVQAGDEEWAGERWVASGLVFTNTIGKALDPTYVTHVFQEQIEAAGLPRQRFHDLRHAAATILAMQRIPINVVRDTLGHSTADMTLNVYTHSDISEHRLAADAMDAALNGVSIANPGGKDDA